MAASIRVGSCIRRILCQKTSLSPLNVVQRGYRNKLRDELVQLYRLREEIGPEPLRHRSEWANWNYNVELFAFGKRLGEDLKEETLRTVFSHKCYIERERKKREDLGIDLQTVSLSLEDNEQLAEQGEVLTSRYIKGYLRHVYPLFFEEGISAVHDYLMSEEMLNYIGRHIGITDLMLCSDFPAKDSTVVKTLKALIGAIQQEKDEERAKRFILDFILPQLIGVDVNETWKVVNPMGLLSAILNSQNRGLPEPRLLRQAGSNTVMAVYHVGIYSHKQLIGKAPGETISIAEEMAARDALKNLMKTADSRPALLLGKLAEDLNFDENKTNISAIDFIKQHEPKQAAEISS